MSDAILKQVVNELAAIRELLTKVLDSQQETQDLSDTRAEIAMVDANGLDPVAYLKDKCRKSRPRKSLVSKNKSRGARV